MEKDLERKNAESPGQQKLNKKSGLQGEGTGEKWHRKQRSGVAASQATVSSAKAEGTKLSSLKMKAQ